MHRIVVFVVCLTLPVVASAQQSNFNVAPPPLPSARFEVGKTEVLVQGMYSSLSGDAVSFTGLGTFATGRKAMSDLLAIDAQVGLLRLGGDSGSGSSAMSLSMNLGMVAADLELQPFRNDWLSVLAFAGANVGGFLGNSTVGSKTYSGLRDGAPSGFLYGAQGGVQVGVGLGAWHLDPFVTVTRVMGTVSAGPVVSTTDIAMTMMAYGANIVYVPLGLSLASLLQAVSGKGDNHGYKTFVVQVGYAFDLTPGHKADPGS